MLKKILTALTLTCLLMTAAPAMAQQSPTERVQNGVEELIKILSDPLMSHPAHHSTAMGILRETAHKYVSFQLATMYSVGKPWLKMSTETQYELVEAFTSLLEQTYLQRIPVYSGQNVEYKNEIISGKKAKVFLEITDKDKTYAIEFRLRLVKNQWMIYDTVAEGISLVANYRSQFAKILSEGTPEDLLKMVQERASEIEAEKQKELSIPKQTEQ